MNQYAADQIALVATLTQARKRTRRWKLLAGLVVAGAAAHQFSTSVSFSQPVKRGWATVQQVAVQAAPTAKPVQPAPVKPAPQPATPVQPSAEERRREAAAAARARRRYEAEVRRTQQPSVPPTPQRVEPPERDAPRPPREPQRGVGLATVLMTAAQAARVAEQIERGRFDPSRELQRAARRAERAERRRRRAERQHERRW